MSLFQVFALLLVLTALFGFVNERTFRLPVTIGVMLVALLASLLMLALQAVGVGDALTTVAEGALAQLDFDDTLLHGVLGYLLFAGALFVDLDHLLERRWEIAMLAFVGTLISTALVALMTYGVTAMLGLDLPWIYCLLFGALISPTDPISVLGILRRLGVPKSLEVKITGESLFNDGLGVVVFLTLLGVLRGEEPTVAHVAGLFVLEVGGGVLMGLALGGLCMLMLKRVDNYQVEILLSLALATGGYVLAEALHLSAPIFAVVAGLLVGNVGRRWAMSDQTREHLDTFWELVDEILNALLFVVLGLELLVITIAREDLLFGLLAIPLVLLARGASVGVAISPLRLRREFPPRLVQVLTWGALRGGISVALALSLPAGPERDLIVTATYVVVMFSILVQGLTLGRVVKSAM